MNPPATQAMGGSEDRAVLRYRGDAGREYHDLKRRLDPDAREWVYRHRAAKLQPWVSPGATVFELGVGAGWNLARLHCARKIGCDAAEFLAERLGELGIEFVGATAGVASGSADVVICHHVLEHLLEPAAALRECRRILRPGGRLVVHVPWDRERRHRHFRAAEPDGHLHTWNAQSLGNLAAALGWQVERVRVRCYGYDRFSANLSARLHAGEPGFRLLRRLLRLVRPLHEVELVAS